MLELEVKMVCLDENNQHVVVLTDKEQKIAFPIWIGLFEAQAIALRLKNEKFPRPLTHDLFISWCKATNSTIDKVVITDITPDSTYVAQIHLIHQNQEKIIDSRPSDAIALALRSNAKIYMTTKLIEFTHNFEDLFPEGLERGETH
ncbi:MAG: bifunctional nuclease family protein [Clostridia bacterium]|nr:bifunctional nuclease family protein [Clostridia bacterium]